MEIPGPNLLSRYTTQEFDELCFEFGESPPLQQKLPDQC